MPIKRVFAGHQRPLLPQFVDALLKERGTDLRSAVVVVPVRRAARRIRELLADRTRGVHRPPRIVTVGDLPELLYIPQQPFATPFTQSLAWVHALQELPEDRLKRITRERPHRLADWLAIAEMISQKHLELAGDGIDFDGVRKFCGQVERFDENDRWRVLSEIQHAYLRELDKLRQWDRQTARLVAVERRECHTDADIFLVGTADLATTHRRMLDQVASQVTAYIHAPPEWSDRYDEYGCVAPAAWVDAPIEIAADALQVIDSPSDQAEQIAAVLAEFGSTYRVDEITVALSEDHSVASIQRVLLEAGATSSWPAGRRLQHTSPFRFLDALADYLEDDRVERFAALIRHPDVGSWLVLRGAPDDWLLNWDRFAAECVPRRISDVANVSPPCRTVMELIGTLVAPLRGGEQRLSHWSARMLEVLRALYGESEFDLQQYDQECLAESLGHLRDVLIEAAEIPEALDPVTSASAAIRTVHASAGRDSVHPAPAEPDAVAIVGWLDVALDDAPAVIVSGLNEGLVPQSVNADPFLPDGLRRQLGILDNARRYARDAHALTSLLNSRERVSLLAMRRDARGDPLAPSRLLLSGDPETIARRIRQFFQPPAPAASPSRIACGEVSAFRIPRPAAELPPIDQLRVTAFADYCVSPYRFYLKHVLQLTEVDDQPKELSASAFGTLIHDVLKLFGRGALSGSTDAAEIREFLSHTLDLVVRRRIGPKRSVAVDLQVEQARQRLDSFATWQADWSSQGWRIVHTEVPDDAGGIRFDLGDGQSIQLRGRIDRIDQFLDADRWMIVDYKTGGSDKSPDRTHQRHGEWVDLQLPLYRHLARPLGVRGDVKLAYLRLPPDTSGTAMQVASWSEDDLLEADEAARVIARQILAGEFWQPLAAAPCVMSEFGPICQDGVMDRELIV